eukprot:TRINITY_DN10762_c0_g1_i1.p1 TRINITY_DN10762_c0_g1~~TRINITY_DN10762_c0_g1_i1.p1  ORF type:complete len:116 (-),score=8.40 TRINITY_DN10762_c0_g1_i1:16-327(-)
MEDLVFRMAKARTSQKPLTAQQGPPGTDEKAAVQVIVRIRPVVARAAQICVQSESRTNTVIVTASSAERDRAFGCDWVAESTASQADMFDMCGRSKVEEFLSG